MDVHCKELDNGQNDYIVKLSYLEIYNERFRDLLRPAVGDAVPNAATLAQDDREGALITGSSIFGKRTCHG